MNEEFWHRKWRTGDIGFHEVRPNPILIRNVHNLYLAPSSRVLLPLCGKTQDIVWLLKQGFRIVGVELSSLAIKELFNALGLEPSITPKGSFAYYSADNIEMYVGNFFDMSEDMLGNIDAIYDRAAMVALPFTMRKKYAELLVRITRSAKQLLITYEYDASRMSGPPFCVECGELFSLYESIYTVKQLERKKIAGGMKLLDDVTEVAWLLQPTKGGFSHDAD